MNNDRSADKQNADRVAFIQAQARMLRDQESSSASASDDLVSAARKRAAEMRSQRFGSPDPSPQDVAERVAFLRRQAEMLSKK